MTTFYDVLIQAAPIIVSIGVAWMAKTLQTLVLHVDRLAMAVQQVRTDLDSIKNNYINRTEFDHAMLRVDKAHEDVRVEFWKLHDEHIACQHCKTKMQ